MFIVKKLKPEWSTKRNQNGNFQSKSHLYFMMRYQSWICEVILTKQIGFLFWMQLAPSSLLPIFQEMSCESQTTRKHIFFITPAQWVLSFWHNKGLQWTLLHRQIAHRWSRYGFLHRSFLNKSGVINKDLNEDASFLFNRGHFPGSSSLQEENAAL